VLSQLNLSLPQNRVSFSTIWFRICLRGSRQSCFAGRLSHIQETARTQSIFSFGMIGDPLVFVRFKVSLLRRFHVSLDEEDDCQRLIFLCWWK
jgi:hypothetical protein